MSEWKEVIAMEFCQEVTDGTHDSPKPVSKGKYLLTSKHLQEFQLDFASAYQISQEDYDKAIARSKVEQHDVLFSMIGTIGTIHRVTISNVDFAVKNMGIFKLGGDEIKSKWLYYWLKTRKAKEYINSCLSGTTQGYMTLKALRNFPIQFPSNEEMIKIVSILSNLDDKIAVNLRICENLEAQVQALFKHWFIDFAPFKDGKFVESELGMIPEGWRVGTLGDVVNQVTDKVGDRNDVRVLSPINTGKLVLSDEFFTKQVYSKSISKYIIVNPDDFAYNPARVNIGSIGRNEYSFIGCVSPVYVVFHCQEHYHFYIDFFRHGNKFKKNVEKLAIGGVRQTLRYEDMARISLVIPPKDVVISFNDIYKKMYETIIQKNDESSRLSTLRDTILPKLMSGQIKL